MKFRWEKKYLYWGITAFLVIVTSIAFFSVINHFDTVKSLTSTFVRILMPFTLAFGFAYLLNPVVNFFEAKLTIPLYKKIEQKRKKPFKAKSTPRVLSILVAMLLAFFVVGGLIIMVFPQLIRSIVGIVNSLPEYLTNFEKFITGFLDNNPGLKGSLNLDLDKISDSILQWAQVNLMSQINSILSKITVGVIGVLDVIMDVLIGVIISIYILFSKERFAAQAKKVVYSIFSIRASNVILKTTRRADKVFGGFIVGKLIDSAIIGVLCFSGMSLFNLISKNDMPFVLLISAIIGITNIIPFFGPFIGAVPSILLIMLVDPLRAVYFGIFVLLLQQFDGNILGPKILGNSTGLSAFWVMFAILLGGGLFGFMGMLLGVPTFAVIYTIIKEFLEARLKKQNLPMNTAEYYDMKELEVPQEVLQDEEKSTNS